MKKIKIEKLKLAKYNPRIINEEQLNKLKNSIKEFGMVQPIVINKDFTVISGHQRIKALESLGLEEVEFIQLDLNAKKEKALNLAMNKIDGEWDTEKLFEIIDDLSGDDELDLTGFNEKEISLILDNGIDIEENNEIKEREILEKTPKSKPGDIYQLGDHRLMCGDSTSLEDIEKLTQSNQMDMVWTDPPYNVDYESSNLGRIKGDNLGDEEFLEFSRQVFGNLEKIVKPNSAFYICSGWQSFSTFQQSLQESGLHISEVIIWIKNRGGIHTIDYPHKHEQIIKAKKLKGTPHKQKAGAIVYGWTNSKKGLHNYYGDRSDYDVWTMDRINSNYLHPTEKPDWLVMRALKNSSKYKDRVIDLFGGSGSALIACEKMGRRAYIMEMDACFVDVIIHRWNKHTNQKAKKINK